MLAASGRAPAIFALIGAAMTQVLRFGPLLVRFYAVAEKSLY